MNNPFSIALIILATMVAVECPDTNQGLLTALSEKDKKLTQLEIDLAKRASLMEADAFDIKKAALVEIETARLKIAEAENKEKKAQEIINKGCQR
jgi:hypothetical protein